MSANKVIEVTNDLQYVSLDSAIEKLTALRDQYGGNAVLDIEMVPVPYERYDTIYASVTVKE